MTTKFTLQEMILLVADEAEYLDLCEEAAIKAGLRTEPLPDRVRKAELFRALHRYLLLIEGKAPKVNAVLREGGHG